MRALRLFFYMLLVGALFALPALVTRAFAGEATLTWELPTGSEQCTNDTTVPVIASSEIWQLVASVPPDQTSYTVEGLAPGDYTFIASVTDDQGQISRLSGSTTKTISDVATAGASAYILVQSDDALVLLDVGTVTADTTCESGVVIMDDNGVTAYKIPAAAVTPYNASQELVVVFAACGS